jgi:Outer membrane protein beta-barrel domain
MKKLIVLFLVAPVYVFAQEETSGIVAPSRFSVGIMFMPEYISLFRAEPTDDKEVVPKAGFSTGVNAEFALKPRFSLRTGLGYGQKSLGYNQTGLVFNSDLNLQGGPSTTSRMEQVYHYSEIQLPVLVQYELIDDRFFVAAGTEIVYAMPGKSERTIYYGNGTVEQMPITSTNQTNVSVLISGGYKFHLAHNLNLALEPMFRYCLIPYPINDGVVYSFGLKTTLNMSF